MQLSPLSRSLNFASRLFLIAFFAIVLLPGAANAETKVATDADKGNDIQIKVGDTLEVRLNANPAAGLSGTSIPSRLPCCT